jgi:hypothetical protein
MGQCNIYLDRKLEAELKSEAKAQARVHDRKRPTPQELLRTAWNDRPDWLREAYWVNKVKAEKGAGKR